jgi:hypothetical protein
MSYISSASGKQYILVLEPAGGGRPDREESHSADSAAETATAAGGKVIAYALGD